ncbi:MAG: GNAT family N-acetyltransferase [Chitinophagaceae bacterium]|nr:GNAT family N-acetyltransferase [Chitinophagaceae bacterium]
MLIRRVELKDAETLSALASKTFYDTFVGTCTEKDMEEFLYEYYNIEQVNSELSDANDYFYFAEVDGVAVGYIRFKEEYSNFEKMKQWKALELKRLYILKEFHGKGVAQALIDFYFQYAQENDYEMAWLGVWEYNFRAQKFYQKNGFEDTGEKHPFPIGSTPQTDIWYWKKLK